MKKQKRVAAIHDISCFGRCSLTVALPILSAAGLETSMIPTAVLSTHTGGFTDYTVHDLTEDIWPIASHWKSLGLGFDAIYTGYLGSIDQIEIVRRLFDLFEDSVYFVDPVMADNGKLYAAFGQDFPDEMAKLCAKAHAIVPNITEATLLLGEAYQEGPYTKQYIEHLLKSLSQLGPQKIFLTGVYLNNTQLGAAAYDRNSGEIVYAYAERIPGSYHGTGDVFGSVLLAAQLANCSLKHSIEIAIDFTVNSLQRSRAENTDTRFGVNFEYGLADLAQMLPPSYSSRKSI